MSLSSLLRIKLLICIAFIGSISEIQAQEFNNEKLESIYQIIKNEPYFTIFGDNYFTTGIPTNSKPSSQNSDVKFEIGFKQRLTNLVLPFNTYGYLTYRQKSFWDVYKESAPFTESNYNPGFGFAKPIVSKKKGFNQGLFFQFEHQSNGRDSIYSRSWNYVSLSYLYMFKENWQFALKVWQPLGPINDNRDLLDYIGRHETSVTYMPNPRLVLETSIRKPLKWNWKGSLQLSVSYKIDKDANQYVYVQYYLGYGESLIDYNENVSMIRVGITFKDFFGNLAKYAQ